MKLCSPSGVWPAKSVANQLTMTAKKTTMPHSDSQIRWGITRIRRNEHREAVALQVVAHREPDGVVHGGGTIGPDAARGQARTARGTRRGGARAPAPPRDATPGARRRRVMWWSVLHHMHRPEGSPPGVCIESVPRRAQARNRPGCLARNRSSLGARQPAWIRSRPVRSDARRPEEPPIRTRTSRARPAPDRPRRPGRPARRGRSAALPYVAIDPGPRRRRHRRGRATCPPGTRDRAAAADRRPGAHGALREGRQPRHRAAARRVAARPGRAHAADAHDQDLAGGDRAVHHRRRRPEGAHRRRQRRAASTSSSRSTTTR